MTPEPAFLEPELEGLLREIAADPRSQLLRLPRPHSLTGLLERPGPVSAARAGLSAAERHLLEVHRDELAEVLRRACLTRFFSDPERSIYLNRSRNAHEQIRFDTPEQWRVRAREALEDARRSAADLAGLDLLEACLRAEASEPITITQLARTSLLLQPTDVAEAYVGIDLTLSGRPRDAIRILRRILDGIPREYVRSCVQESTAHAYSIIGELDFARECYRDAALTQELRPSAIVGWLLLSMQSGDKDAAHEAARELDESAEDAHGATLELVEKYKKQVTSGHLIVAPGATTVAQEIRDRQGSLSQEVALALVSYTKSH